MFLNLSNMFSLTPKSLDLRLKYNTKKRVTQVYHW